MEVENPFTQMAKQSKLLRQQHLDGLVAPVITASTMSSRRIEKKVDTISNQMTELLNLYKFLGEKVQALEENIPKEVVRRHRHDEEPMLAAISNLREAILPINNNVRLVNLNALTGLGRLSVIYKNTVQILTDTKDLVSNLKVVSPELKNENSLGEDIKDTLRNTERLFKYITTNTSFLTTTIETNREIISANTTMLSDSINHVSENVERITSSTKKQQKISKTISNDIGKLRFAGEKILADRETINITLPKILTQTEAISKIVPDIQTTINDKKVIIESLPKLFSNTTTISDLFKGLDKKVGNLSEDFKQVFGGFFTKLEVKLDGVPDLTQKKFDTSVEVLTKKLDSIPEATKAKLADTFEALSKKVDSIPDTTKANLDNSFEALEKKVDDVPDITKTNLNDSFEALAKKVDEIPDTTKAKLDDSFESLAKKVDQPQLPPAPPQSSSVPPELLPVPHQSPPVPPQLPPVPPQMPPVPPQMPPVPPQLPPVPPQLPAVSSDRPSKRLRLEEPTFRLMDIGYAFSKGKSRRKRPETLNVDLPERIIQLILQRDKEFPKNRVNSIKRSKEVNICWVSYVKDLEVIEWNKEGECAHCIQARNRGEEITCFEYESLKTIRIYKQIV
ncbi:hypothetical protein BELL_1645g00010 [Botrytis elliptica]|uniref:Uncharacterized protein n=1 Tax=Botrytis elliptica TaxID=278938 RepID=A0A4Z1HUZ9_9HELO|nr:hypothetical protein EAE99_010487 [Botrytis elliptica]TGO52584.1 hypothetical protein BELL_1645g00010 [Botrytis elliptica]